jgi:hypothetical protein
VSAVEKLVIYQGLKSHSLFFIVTENDTTNFVIKKDKKKDEGHNNGLFVSGL